MCTRRLRSPALGRARVASEEAPVPASHVADRAILLDERRLIPPSLVLPDGDVLKIALADRLDVHVERRAGVGEPGWPSPSVQDRVYHLVDSSLAESAAGGGSMDIRSPQTVGLASGEYMPWFAFGPAEELPGDQQTEDAGSLVFDTEVLSENLAILGNPLLRARLSSDQPQALVAARLCDVWPDGSSTLISRGILNLSQRGGKSTPRSLRPGEIADVEVGLNHVGYDVPRGHRLRLSISTSYMDIAGMPAAMLMLWRLSIADCRSWRPAWERVIWFSSPPIMAVTRPGRAPTTRESISRCWPMARALRPGRSANARALRTSVRALRPFLICNPWITGRAS